MAQLLRRSLATSRALRAAATATTTTVSRWASAAPLFQGAAETAAQDLSSSKPQSLGLPTDSKLRYVDPPKIGFKGTMLRMLGFYGTESTSIRGGNRLYARIKSLVEKPELYSSFGLEKKFRTFHAMLVLHVWLCLVRLRFEEDKKRAGQVGQTMYDVFNRDMELRMRDEGVKLTVLISRWMKELEKAFYGACMAYDKAMQPTAAQDELPRALWRNVFAEDNSPMPSGPDLARVQALANYVRREAACLALTESEDVLTGNIVFSKASNTSKPAV